MSLITEPVVEVCYRNGVFTMPTGYDPPPERFASTPGDNIAELAGRLCYASINKDRPGRPTAEYHANLLTTRHHSVYAHVVETFEATTPDVDSDEYDELDLLDATTALHCRPGVWVTGIGPRRLRFCISLRAVIEWSNHGVEWLDWDVAVMGDKPDAVADVMYARIYEALVPLYPFSLRTAPAPKTASYACEKLGIRRVVPELPKEKWTSLYIAGVSRDLLQELVRHHWQANPSVRSTRYVDESDSNAVLPPAISDMSAFADAAGENCRDNYVVVYDHLVKKGVDKKTARGAARSFLPGATETRLVMSASEFQWKHLINLRADESTGAVDPEILRLAKKIREVLGY